MQLVSTTIKKYCLLFLSFFILTATSFAQINSPYTRYGLGDLTRSQSIATLGMGGISSAYSDIRTINFSNPASFAYLDTARFNNSIVTFDLGVNIESRTLRSRTPISKYNSANFSPSYFAIASPLKKSKGWGMAFGFVPVSKINYSILKSERTGIDSMQTLYEGSGGLNEAFIGVGKKWNNGLSLGVSTGYHFGKKEISTKRTFVNDTVIYAKTDYSTITNFGGMFLNAGLQYSFLLSKNFDSISKKQTYYFLKLGSNINLAHTLSASQDFERKTYEYDYSGNQIKIDSILKGSGNNGKIKIPFGYTIGAILQKTTNSPTKGANDNWSIGFDFSATQWKDYSYYNQKDLTVNSWMFKLGGVYTPIFDPNSKSYLNRVTYRAGFNLGKDYVDADGKQLKMYAITLGAGLPVRMFRGISQSTTVQTAIEFGKRGSAVNNITENFFKLSVGFSLNDIWFIKRKYD